MGKLYRSRDSEEAVRAWCRARLDGWPLPHTRTTLATSLGPTHLTSLGSGPDTCLFLPGTNFNAATSTGLLTALAEHCHVICADLPGQPGLSSAERPTDETDGYSRWVAEVLEATRPDGRTVLMGHSRGAAVALTAPVRRVDALVLLSPAGLAQVQLTMAVLVRSAAWLVRPTASRSARLVELMSGGPIGEELGPVVEWLTLVARSTRTTGAPGPLPDDLLDRWQGSRARVLAGAQDPFFPPPRLQRPTQERLHTRVEVITDAGHLLVDQRPDAVAAALATELEHGRTA